MSDSEWRSRIWWVVVHPHRPELLMVEQAGVLALPETKLRAKVWTADATTSSDPWWLGTDTSREGARQASYGDCTIPLLLVAE